MGTVTQATHSYWKGVGLVKPGFHVVDGWGMLPPGYRYQEVSDVAVDGQNNVYVHEEGAGQGVPGGYQAQGVAGDGGDDQGGNKLRMPFMP